MTHVNTKSALLLISGGRNCTKHRAGIALGVGSRKWKRKRGLVSLVNLMSLMNLMSMISHWLGHKMNS